MPVTVTNGVYTTGSYADPSWITSLSGSKITGAMTGTTIGFDDVTSATNLGTGTIVGQRFLLLDRQVLEL